MDLNVLPSINKGFFLSFDLKLYMKIENLVDNLFNFYC